MGVGSSSLFKKRRRRGHDKAHPSTARSLNGDIVMWFRALQLILLLVGVADHVDDYGAGEDREVDRKEFPVSSSLFKVLRDGGHRLQELPPL